MPGRWGRVTWRKRHWETGDHVWMIVSPWWRMRCILSRSERAISRCKVKGLGVVLRRRFYINSLSGEDIIQVIEIEARDVTPEENLTLENLTFDFLNMASRSKSLPVPIFLVALHTGGNTGCAFGMLGIALGMFKATRSVNHSHLGKLPNNSRCRPTGLALIFLLRQRAQASCDLRSRRGSLIDGDSSFSPFCFFLFRPFEAEAA